VQVIRLSLLRSSEKHVKKLKIKQSAVFKEAMEAFMEKANKDQSI